MKHEGLSPCSQKPDTDRPIPRPCVTFRNKLHFFNGEELSAPDPTPKLEDHTLSAVRDCLFKTRRPFEKFVNSLHYSESELCGSAVTVSFSKHLPWQAMHVLQRSTHFSKTCCRPLITSKFLAAELPFHGWKSPKIAWGEIWTVWRMF
jgi:hypothetical protein